MRAIAETVLEKDCTKLHISKPSLRVGRTGRSKKAKVSGDAVANWLGAILLRPSVALLKLVCFALGGDLVAFIVNYDCSCEMVTPTLPGDQDIPRDPLFVIAPAMKLIHFPRIDDPCIRNREKSGTLPEGTWQAKASAL
jgi:hypothetical protein